MGFLQPKNPLNSLLNGKKIFLQINSRSKNYSPFPQLSDPGVVQPELFKDFIRMFSQGGRVGAPPRLVFPVFDRKGLLRHFPVNWMKTLEPEAPGPDLGVIGRLFQAVHGRNASIEPLKDRHPLGSRLLLKDTFQLGFHFVLPLGRGMEIPDKIGSADSLAELAPGAFFHGSRRLCAVHLLSCRYCTRHSLPLTCSFPQRSVLRPARYCAMASDMNGSGRPGWLHRGIALFPVCILRKSAARIPIAAIRLPPPAPPIWIEGTGGFPFSSPSSWRIPARADKFMSCATRSR